MAPALKKNNDNKDPVGLRKENSGSLSLHRFAAGLVLFSQNDRFCPSRYKERL